MDIIEALLGEHGALSAQFDYLEAAAPQLPLSALKAQADLLAAALQSHARLEDELLFTALEPALGAGSPALLGMRLMHEEIDRGLEACRAAVDETEAQGDLLGVLGLARQHFLGEEQTLFPIARERISRETREALGAEWAARRSVAPTVTRAAAVEDAETSSDGNVSHYLRTHRLHAETLRFALGTEGRPLQAAAAAAAAGRAAKTLVKEGPLRVTVVALRKGAVLAEHHITGPASIHILSGRLTVSTRRGNLVLAAEDLMAVDAGVAHAAEALEDCTLLITVAMPSPRRDGDPPAGQGGRCDVPVGRQPVPAAPEPNGRSATG